MFFKSTEKQKSLSISSLKLITHLSFATSDLANKKEQITTIKSIIYIHLFLATIKQTNKTKNTMSIHSLKKNKTKTHITKPLIGL